MSFKGWGASSGRGHHGARRCTREGSQVGLSGAQSHKTWNGQWPGVTASYGQRCMVPCEVTSMCQNTLAMQPHAGGMPLECGGGNQASRILVIGGLGSCRRPESLWAGSAVKEWSTMHGRLWATWPAQVPSAAVVDVERDRWFNQEPVWKNGRMEVGSNSQ
jgi:hypothetical protein